MIKTILKRLFGEPQRTGAAAIYLLKEEEPPARPGESTCIIVEPLGSDRAAVLTALQEAGIKVSTVSKADVGGVGNGGAQPNLIISAFEDQIEFRDTMDVLNKNSYKGLVQPIDRSAGNVSAVTNRANQVRALEPIRTPVSSGSLRKIVETEGLARTPSGHVAVSLATAMSNKWLEFAFQPKIALNSMTLAGAETLARVRHPIHGVLLPSAFLPHSTAQDLRLLGVASIRAALSSWAPFHRLGFNLMLSVNMPLETLEAPAIVEVIKSLRPSDRQWPGLLVEVNSAEVLGAAQEVKEFAEKGRSAGVFLSLDSFGLGKTMTTDLSTLPISEVKLHPDLVQGSSSNPARGVACQGASQLARAYGASVSCSSVETISDLTFLRNMGCDSAQGRVFAPPVSRSEFAQMLQSRAVADPRHP